MNEQQSLRSLLEQKIQQKHLLNHSLYKRWQMGELSQDELRGYAKEYYSFENEFSRFVSAVHSKCEDQQIRQSLLENLIHEEKGEDNHPSLWERFAEGLGASKSDLDNHFHSDETEHLLSTYRNYTRGGDVIEGLAALYVYERQQPDVARQKIDGLERFYGLTEDRPLAFFREHQTADVFHSDTEMKAMEQLCKTPEDQEKVLAAADKALDALNEFLTGVERRYQVAA